MLATGVPTAVAHDIAAHENDPAKMAKAVVATTMNQTHGPKGGDFKPAAAFDVIDLDPANPSPPPRNIAANARRFARTRAPSTAWCFSQGKSMPWRTDRPAIALYDTVSQDGRLDASVRAAASHARGTVADTVLAHRESDDFEPFDDADYSNAYGPTAHFPVTARQIDAWAPQVSETDNEFYKNVGADDLTRAIA